MSSDPTSANLPRSSTQADPAQPAGELAREKDEVLRLRALLIARDAELGTARGRILEFETRARYVLGVVRRLRALPALARRVLPGPRSPRS